MRTTPRPAVHGMRLASGLLALVLLGGPPWVSAQHEQGDPRVRFGQAMRACTAEHGYNPAGTAALGPHELGEGELPWRACVYSGIRRILVPFAPTPQPFERLIAEDQRMTEALVAGEITRAQRKRRIEAMVAGLRQAQRLDMGVSGPLDTAPERSPGLSAAELKALKRFSDDAVFAPLMH